MFTPCLSCTFVCMWISKMVSIYFQFKDFIKSIFGAKIDLTKIVIEINWSGVNSRTQLKLYIQPTEFKVRFTKCGWPPKSIWEFIFVYGQAVVNKCNARNWTRMHIFLCDGYLSTCVGVICAWMKMSILNVPVYSVYVPNIQLRVHYF